MPMFVTMVFHHPVPDHVADFASFMRTIEDGMAGTDGLLSLESYRDTVNEQLVAIGRWESAEHAMAGIPRLMSIGGRDPSWTVHEDQVFQLESL
jgi:heme-degrading monooxygenase HmoA